MLQCSQCRAQRVEAELKALQRQLKEVSGHVDNHKKEIGVLNELNRGLMSNQSVYKDKLSELEATHKEKDSTIAVRCLQIENFWIAAFFTDR